MFFYIAVILYFGDQTETSGDLIRWQAIADGKGQHLSLKISNVYVKERKRHSARGARLSNLLG